MRIKSKVSRLNQSKIKANQISCESNNRNSYKKTRLKPRLVYINDMPITEF